MDEIESGFFCSDETLFPFFLRNGLYPGEDSFLWENDGEKGSLSSCLLVAKKKAQQYLLRHLRHGEKIIKC